MARPRIPVSRRKPVRLPTIFRVTPNEELELKLIPHGHLQAMIEGRGDHDAFNTITFRVMVGACMTGLIVEEDLKHVEPLFKDALNGLIAIGDRFERLGKFGANGDEVRWIKEALNLTDELQTVTTRKQQAASYKTVERFVGGFAYTMNNLRNLKERM